MDSNSKQQNLQSSDSIYESKERVIERFIINLSGPKEHQDDNSKKRKTTLFRSGKADSIDRAAPSERKIVASEHFVFEPSTATGRYGG